MPLGTGRPSSSKAGRPQAVPKGQAGGRRISNHPEDAESGGGAPDNVDVEITAARADTWEYPGRSDLGPVPALLVTIKINGQEGEQEQAYTGGDLQHVVPSADGECFMAAEGSSRKGLNDNCNAMLFIQSLIDQGFPNDERLDKFSNLVGLTGHMIAIAPKKKREGLEGGNKPIAVFNKIHKMPWEAKGKAAPSRTSPPASRPASRAPAPTAQEATNGEADDPITAEAIEVLTSMLGESPLPLKDEKGKSIGMQVFQAIPKNPNRSAILKKISEKGFFEQDGLPFAVDGDQVVLL